MVAVELWWNCGGGRIVGVVSCGGGGIVVELWWWWNCGSGGSDGRMVVELCTL